MALMVSVSGIRGIYGTDLTPENLARFTAAYGSWLQGGTVVVGRDTRVTGEVCEQVVTAALRSVGCDVIRLGVVPTPTVAMGVLRHNAAGGIIISASHNPAEWNALKLLNNKSEFLDAGQGAAVIKLAEQGGIRYVDYRGLGSQTDDETILDYHIDRILNLPYIDAETIRARNFHVALDAVNGAGSIAVPRLFERLGVTQVHALNCTPDGLFPHNPEPIPEHLTDICELVRDTGSDLGFVVDPDADRLATVMNGGELLGEEYTLALATEFMLRRNAGPCVTNLSSSNVTRDIAHRFDQECFQSAVGEINVVKEMQHRGAVIGGEGNGGVINPDLHYGRDSLVGIAMTLQFLAENNLDLAAYRKSLPDYHIVKMKKQLEGVDADAVLARLVDTYAVHKPVTIDGVKINFPRGWVHMRKSNTEPIIRVYAEARDAATARELARSVMDELG